MKTVLLIGMNNFGVMLAARLHELGHQVMAVDKDEAKINSILPIVTDAQIGDCTNRNFLVSLGINNYDVCFVAIGKDFQTSLETTSLLKELGARLVVSRAERDVQSKFLLRNGADEVINPEKQMAEWTAIRYASNHILDYIKLDDENAIIEVPVPEEWVNRTVGQIVIRKKYGVNIMAVKESGKMNPVISPETTFKSGTTMLVLGQYRAIKKCFHI